MYAILPLVLASRARCFAACFCDTQTQRHQASTQSPCAAALPQPRLSPGMGQSRAPPFTSRGS
eukprot:scaffold40231_cov343-Isochrysis_galbana.AAC.1